MFGVFLCLFRVGFFVLNKEKICIPEKKSVRRRLPDEVG